MEAPKIALDFHPRAAQGEEATKCAQYLGQRVLHFDLILVDLGVPQAQGNPGMNNISFGIPFPAISDRVRTPKMARIILSPACPTQSKDTARRNLCHIQFLRPPLRERVNYCVSLSQK